MVKEYGCKMLTDQQCQSFYNVFKHNSLFDFLNMITLLDLSRSQQLFKYFFQQPILEMNHNQARSLSAEQWSALLKVVPVHWILAFGTFNDLKDRNNNGMEFLAIALYDYPVDVNDLELSLIHI